MSAKMVGISKSSHFSFPPIWKGLHRHFSFLLKRVAVSFFILNLHNPTCANHILYINHKGGLLDKLIEVHQ